MLLTRLRGRAVFAYVSGAAFLTPIAAIAQPLWPQACEPMPSWLAAPSPPVAPPTAPAPARTPARPPIPPAPLSSEEQLQLFQHARGCGTAMGTSVMQERSRLGPREAVDAFIRQQQLPAAANTPSNLVLIGSNRALSTQVNLGLQRGWDALRRQYPQRQLPEIILTDPTHFLAPNTRTIPYLREIGLRVGSELRRGSDLASRTPSASPQSDGSSGTSGETSSDDVLELPPDEFSTGAIQAQISPQLPEPLQMMCLDRVFRLPGSNPSSGSPSSDASEPPELPPWLTPSQLAQPRNRIPFSTQSIARSLFQLARRERIAAYLQPSSSERTGLIAQIVADCSLLYQLTSHSLLTWTIFSNVAAVERAPPNPFGPLIRAAAMTVQTALIQAFNATPRPQPNPTAGVRP